MKAIVYTSDTGFTKKYAELLSDNIGIKAVFLNDAKHTLNKNDEIIYMGPVNAGKIAGFASAKKLFAVKCLCAVGLTEPKKVDTEQMKAANSVNDIPLFYFQGGVRPNKLKGIKKFIIKFVLKHNKDTLLELPKNHSFDEIMNDGIDFVREINLKEVIVWYHKNKVKL